MPIGAAIGLTGLLGAGASLFGASQQASATNKATDFQKSMFDILQKNLQPYQQFGAEGIKNLSGALPDLTSKFNPTMAQLEGTPGYQFALDQGTKAVNNSNSAKGWGQSGPGARGIAQYATGLASQTYQQQFQNDLAQKAQIYQLLMGPVNLGEQAAGAVGQGAQTLGGQVGSNLIGGANAMAGGAIGAANSLSGAASNYAFLPYLMQALGGASGTGGSPGFSGYSPEVSSLLSSILSGSSRGSF